MSRERIIIGAVVIGALMLAFPPFHLRLYTGAMINLGYAFLFSPPYHGNLAGNVDIAMLAMQWAGLAAAVAALLWARKK